MNETFLERVFGGKPEHLAVLLYCLPSHSQRVFADLHEAAEWSKQQPDNVYVACALVENKSFKGRNAAGDARALPAIWAEIDKDPAASLQKLKERGIPSPSVVVGSGHGYHLWWVLREPWELPDEAEQKKAQLFVRGFQKTLRAIVGQLDSTHDLARVLRIPGTLNYKENPPLPVTLIENSETDYNLSDFEGFVDEVPEAVAAISADVGNAKEVSDFTLAAAFESDPEFKSVWEHLAHPERSQSEFDMAIASRLASMGFSEQVVAGAIVRNRREFSGKDKHPGYVERTVGKAISRARAAGVEENKLEEVSGPLPEDPPTKEPIIPGDFQRSLGVNVVDVIKYKAEEPTFAIVTDTGVTVNIGTAAQVLSQQYVASCLISALNVVPPQHKGDKWRQVIQELLNHKRDVDVGGDSDSEVGASVTEYLAEKDVIHVDSKGAESAISMMRPFAIDGEIVFFAQDFKSYLLDKRSYTNARDVALRLQEAGWKSERIPFKRGKVCSSRSVWKKKMNDDLWLKSEEQKIPEKEAR